MVGKGGGIRGEGELEGIGHHQSNIKNSIYILFCFFEKGKMNNKISVTKN